MPLRYAGKQLNHHLPKPPSRPYNSSPLERQDIQVQTGNIIRVDVLPTHGSIFWGPRESIYWL